MTLVLLKSSSLIPYGNDLSIIIISNVSLLSEITSSTIGTSNEEQVAPAGNVTSYTVCIEP